MHLFRLERTALYDEHDTPWCHTDLVFIVGFELGKARPIECAHHAHTIKGWCPHCLAALEKEHKHGDNHDSDSGEPLEVVPAYEDVTTEVVIPEGDYIIAVYHKSSSSNGPMTASPHA